MNTKLLIFLSALIVSSASAQFVAVSNGIIEPHNNALLTGNTTIIGNTTSTGSATFSGNVNVSGNLTSNTTGSAGMGIGYGLGSGNSVLQLTSRTTAVVWNGMSGNIITNNTSLATNSTISFTVTDSSVLATDTIIPTLKAGATQAATKVRTATVSAGAFGITVDTIFAGGAETGNLTINLGVYRSSTQ